MTQLPLADPAVAEATFKEHLAAYLASDRAKQRGIELVSWLNGLTCIIRVPAARATGEREDYFLRVEATHYDLWPVEVRFVCPPGEGVIEWAWPDSKDGNRWFPKIPSPSFAFGLHSTYTFEPEKETLQLICFSMTAGYYRSNHSPSPEQKWRQGYHTVAATLNRIAEVLHAPQYLEPSGPA